MKSTIATTSVATATPSKGSGGATPKSRGSGRSSETDAGPVSAAGISVPAVESLAGPVAAPQSGQKRAPYGSSAPHSAQASAAARDAFMLRFCPRFERT